MEWADFASYGYVEKLVLYAYLAEPQLSKMRPLLLLLLREGARIVTYGSHLCGTGDFEDVQVSSHYSDLVRTYLRQMDEDPKRWQQRRAGICRPVALQPRAGPLPPAPVPPASPGKHVAATQRENIPGLSRVAVRIKAI